MLDVLSGGRMIVGIGRGAGRIEFDGLRIPQAESRERFVEASRIVLRALEEGRVESDGPFYKVPARDIRPRPFRSFHGRTYGAMVSPETAEILAELGVGLLIIPQKPWEEIARDLSSYEDACRRLGREPRPPVAAAWVYCAEDEREARKGAQRWIGSYWRSAMAHYEIGGAHFKGLKGYEYYGELAKLLDTAGPEVLEHITEAFVATQVWGTPAQCREKIAEIEERVHTDHFVGVFSFGGMPYEDAERSLRLFAAEVLPGLQGKPAKARALSTARRRPRRPAASSL